MKNKSNGLGLASMIIGIIALLLSFYYGGILGIISLILGIICLTKPDKKGTAVAGVVTSSISILVLLGLLLLHGYTSSDSDLNANIGDSEDIQTSNSFNITTEDIRNDDTTENTEVSNSIVPSTEGQNNSEEIEYTVNMGLAVRTARRNLDLTYFSYERLIEQLEYDGYTHEEAVYAADNCGADWNEEALRAAIEHLTLSPFSYSGLVQQLEYEKFTTEQATYAADNCDADWYAQALRTANLLVESDAYSQSGLNLKLEFLGFTSEQAEYGSSLVGF